MTSGTGATLSRALGLPLHRKDVPVDSCRLGGPDVPCETCAQRLGQHRADVAA